MNGHAPLIFGLLVGVFGLPLIALILRAFHIEVEDGEHVLVQRFGKLAATLKEPGWHWLPDRIFPWVMARPVSVRHDFRHIGPVLVNDARGTTVLVDVFLEVRVVDAARAKFAVADWDQALRSLVSHAVISILSDREFTDILCDRTALGERLKKEIAIDTERWGVAVEAAYLRNVGVLPEVADQLLRTVAARLERAKADIEEEGRQRVALLDAETSARVAKLVAEAKGQYPEAIGRAYTSLKVKPAVFEAYKTLYELSLYRPNRMVAFAGFNGDGLRAVDAAMLAPAEGAGPTRASGAST